MEQGTDLAGELLRLRRHGDRLRALGVDEVGAAAVLVTAGCRPGGRPRLGPGLLDGCAPHLGVTGP